MPIVPGDGDPRHGTRNGYGNLRCRCADCTEAHRVYCFQWMHADPERMFKHALAEALRRRGALKQLNKEVK